MAVDHGSPQQKKLCASMSPYEKRKYEEMLKEYERLSALRRATGKEITRHLVRVRNRQRYHDNKPRFMEAAE